MAITKILARKGQQMWMEWQVCHLPSLRTQIRPALKSWPNQYTKDFGVKYQAIGLILLSCGILQIGLSLQSAARKHLCQMAALNWRQAEGLR